jgi:hypothetical protein
MLENLIGNLPILGEARDLDFSKPQTDSGA